MFKASSFLGEGEIIQGRTQNQGTITVSPDGWTLAYSSPYTGGEMLEGLPHRSRLPAADWNRGVYPGPDH